MADFHFLRTSFFWFTLYIFYMLNFHREAVVTQQSSEGEEVEVGVLGAEEYFGEIALLFDK